MPRKTIKSLEQQLETCRELREADSRTMSRLDKEKIELQKTIVIQKDRITDLENDKRWLKSLVQNLTGDKLALPR